MLKLLLTIITSIFIISEATAIEWNRVELPGSSFIHSFYKSGDEAYIGCIGVKKIDIVDNISKYCNKYNYNDTTIQRYNGKYECILQSCN